MTPRDFFATWTHAEALAKFFDVPILAWLRQHPLVVPQLGHIQEFDKCNHPNVQTFTAS